MKKYLFSALVAMLLCNMAQAQQTVVKLNPLSLIFATANVAVEHAISDNASIQLGGAIGGFSLGGGDIKTSYTGFSAVPEFRFYLTEKPAPAGFFVGPFGVYRSYTTKQTVVDFDGETYDAKQNLSIFGGGLNIGYQLITDSGFSLDFFGGPCYSTSSSKVVEGNEDDITVSSNLAGFGLRLGMTLGWSF